MGLSKKWVALSVHQKLFLGGVGIELLMRGRILRNNRVWLYRSMYVSMELQQLVLGNSAATISSVSSSMVTLLIGSPAGEKCYGRNLLPLYRSE